MHNDDGVACEDLCAIRAAEISIRTLFRIASCIFSEDDLTHTPVECVRVAGNGGAQRTKFTIQTGKRDSRNTGSVRQKRGVNLKNISALFCMLAALAAASPSDAAPPAK